MEETILPEKTPASTHQDSVRLNIADKEIILVGTAHISRHSADLVREVIELEKPDCVCVELDTKRYQALISPNRWESLNLKEIIKKRQLSTLIVNLMLSSYQKRLGLQTGVQPGTELLEAVRVAEEAEIRVELSDRDIRITLQRAWRKTGFFRKIALISSLIASVFDKSEISEEQLEEIKQEDVLSEMLKEMSTALPEVKETLIDERDLYLAEKIRSAPGKKIVAVVGAGHLQGIVRTLKDGLVVDLAKIEEIPPATPVFKIIGWTIPAAILAALVYIGFTKGPQAAGDNAVYWILANGIPAAFGALLAMAHPLTILVAFLAAPFTSLTPVIGAGYVTAFVQAWVQPPRVFELKAVADDLPQPKRWWKNRLIRIFLAFLLPGLGSMAGTALGGFRIFSNL